jgi:hypothetical protein
MRKEENAKEEMPLSNFLEKNFPDIIGNDNN